MGLQVWLPLNGDTKQQGLSSITMTGSPNSWANGKIGQCAHFAGNAANAIYNNTTDFNYTDNFSWAVWIKTNFTGTTAQYAFTNGRVDTGGYGYGIRCISSADCHVRFGNQSYLIPVTGGEWTHLAFTKKGTLITIYKNGSVHTSQTFNGTLPTYSDGNGLGLGCFHYSGNIYPFYGDLNDFRIYDHVLSPREVKEISKGLVLHYPLAMPGQENIIANTSHEIECTYPASGVKDYYSVKTKSVPNETQYTLSFEARSTVDGDHLRTHFYSPNTTTTCESSQGIIKTASDGNMDFTLTTEWRRYWVVYTQTETTAIKSVICPRLCSPASYPSSQSGTGTVYVRNQKLEHGSHPTPWIPNPTDAEYSTLGFNDGIEYDVSGYGYNGTKVGSITYSSDTLRYQTSTNFNGTDNGILIQNLPLSDIINTSVTYSFWIKPSGENGGRSVYFGSYSGTSWSIEKTAANQIRGYWNGNPDVIYSGATITDNIWQHICITKNGTSDVKIYINGVLKATSTAAHNTLSFPTTFRIGRDTRSGDGTPYKGLMSDFRIYSTALSADDILELYHTPISLSNNGTLLTQGEFVES